MTKLDCNKFLLKELKDIAKSLNIKTTNLRKIELCKKINDNISLKQFNPPISKKKPIPKKPTTLQTKKKIYAKKIKEPNKIWLDYLAQKSSENKVKMDKILNANLVHDNNSGIPTQLINKPIYLVFECTYLEDGWKPEYKFVKAFLKKDEAEQCLQNIKNDYLKFNKIVEHYMTKNKYSTPLFWDEKNNTWHDYGSYTSVSLNQILLSLK